MDEHFKPETFSVKVSTVIFSVVIALVAVAMLCAHLYGSGRISGIEEATNFVAAKCQQKNEFRVTTNSNTFFFSCNMVKTYPITPWDNVDISKPPIP